MPTWEFFEACGTDIVAVDADVSFRVSPNLQTNGTLGQSLKLLGIHRES